MGIPVFLLTGYNEVYSGMNMEHNLSALSPGMKYSVRLSCESEGGLSKVSSKKYLIFIAPDINPLFSLLLQILTHLLLLYLWGNNS